MRLLDAFSYVDQTGGVWDAPKGSLVDGASIPQAFWTIIGGPFEGDYRNASVVHDVACDLKKRPWRDVHKMFYDAMRCGGVSEKKAKVMYFAVFHFGPRWTLDGTPLAPKGDKPTKEGAQAIADWIEKNNPTLVEIEKNRSAK